MKKLIMIALVLVSIHAIAQEERPAPAEKVKEELNLTEEQAEKMKTAHDDMREKMKEIKESDLSRADKMRKSADVIEAHEEHLQSFLTEEQFQKLQSLQGKRRDKREDRIERFREKRKG